MKVVFSAAALILLVSLPSEAQQLNLQISNGRVTLDAVNVPARQILAEWARIGDTRVIGAEKLAGTPLTLRLVDMPERQALDIILRNAAGFMAAPRQASVTPGASAYDRILIMATSSVVPPQPAGRNVPPPGVANGTQRRLPPRPPNMIAGDEPPMDDQGNPVNPVEDDQADTGMAPQPVFTFPTPPPGMQPGQNPVFVPVQPNGPFGAAPGVAQPVISLQPNENGPTIYNFVPQDQSQPQQPPAPNTPFGVFGSPQPGMIQIPQPPQPQPGQPQRPPGER